MELSEAIRQLQDLHDSKKELLTGDNELDKEDIAIMEAIETVLHDLEYYKVNNARLFVRELERLQEEKCELYHEAYQQGRADALFEQMSEPKEISFREGLELIKKECTYNRASKLCLNCPNTELCDEFDETLPQDWDIDEIVSAVEKL